MNDLSGRLRRPIVALFNWYIASGVPFLPAMMPIPKRQLLLRQQSKPKKKWQRRPFDIFRQPANRLNTCFLNHVRRIEAPLPPATHAEGNQLAEPFAVSDDQ